MRSKIEAMKNVARLIRNHLEGIVAWARMRMTNGFLKALNGLFQAAKRKARGYRRLSTTCLLHADSYHHLPDRWKTRLPYTQSTCSLTHLEFKRAFKTDCCKQKAANHDPGGYAELLKTEYLRY